MNLLGIHHVSALTANAKKNYEFYTNILGMRLVKKTVNQDEPSMYHLFYADEYGSPGTDLTFFEIPRAGHTYPGNQSISTTSLRIKQNDSLTYWKKRFEELHVTHGTIKEYLGRKTLPFQDHEGQRLMLISDEGVEGTAAGTPPTNSPIPPEHAIVGLGPIHLTVAALEPTKEVLTKMMGFNEIYADPQQTLFETSEGGNGAQVVVEERADLKRERPGRGSVHHVAFRVKDEDELSTWKKRIEDAGFPNSGLVDRYYFKSLYFREPNHILFELATDGPGFAADEEEEHLGETLALPPFLEADRSQIEAGLVPLHTKKET
ncbi:ring-cleaving dioxygenase [Halobacillus salinarum]|uniref:Ring-cleaving dioxygenase n=1 Tax=Halobacillus salinarum TaxID=2932257 RepID=A0ABY4EL49_9BACI|nr:ring-cleaving dioxygenase [Halobacillus salinarum]UOQ45190.1 ring-cleaving dioxygenase [Halobacillus salinarum]